MSAKNEESLEEGIINILDESIAEIVRRIRENERRRLMNKVLALKATTHDRRVFMQIIDDVFEI